MDSFPSHDAWLVAASLCAFLVLAGHVTLESGLVRAKHSVNAAAKALVQAGLTVLVVWAAGHGLMAGEGSRFAGAGPFLPGAEAASAGLLFDIALAAAAATILSGPIAERATLRGYAAMVVLFAALIFPLAAHWAWSPEGWLRAIGFVDLAGAATIHVAGGAAALAAAWTIGPRAGHFTSARRTVVVQSQSFPFAALGVLLLWLGWFGIAAGRAAGLGLPLAPVILNLLLAGAGGIAVAFLANQLRPKEVTVVHLIHGTLAGLVAASGTAHLVPPSLAVGLGALGAAAAIGGARLIERLEIDDALGIASVHLFAGAVGALAAIPIAGNPAGALIAQVFGTAVIAAWGFAAMAAGLAAAGAVLSLRVDAERERVGLNVAEHQMTTDVALLVSQLGAMNRHAGSFAYLDADADGELGQIAREYNRAVDIFRAQVSGMRSQLETAQMEIGEAQAVNARLAEDLAVRDERLEEAAREVAVLTDQLGRALVTVQGLQNLRAGLVRLIGRAFRTPIERLHSMAKRAGETRSPADMDALIETAREEAARLARRLADVIDFAEASTFETLPASDRVSVERLVSEINLLYRPRAEAKKLRLRVTWGPDVAGMAASAPALRKIMGELIGHSIDVTPQGGIVSLTASRGQDGSLVLDVVDSSNGISPGEIAAALDPLAAGEGADPARLGLALVKKLVDLNGGTFSIRSRPGVGTQMRVTIAAASLEASAAARSA